MVCILKFDFLLFFSNFTPNYDLILKGYRKLDSDLNPFSSSSLDNTDHSISKTLEASSKSLSGMSSRLEVTSGRFEVTSPDNNLTPRRHDVFGPPALSPRRYLCFNFSSVFLLVVYSKRLQNYYT